MNLITGVSPSDSGTVMLDGKRLNRLSPPCASVPMPVVARTFQNIRLFEHLTVRQNVEVAFTSSEFHRARQVSGMTIDRLLDQMDLLEMADRPAPNAPLRLSAAPGDRIRALALGLHARETPTTCCSTSPPPA